MTAEVFIATRVTAETKERFAAIARQQGLSQSVLLKRSIAATLMAADTTSLNLDEPSKPLPASGKISVRLRPDPRWPLQNPPPVAGQNPPVAGQDGLSVTWTGTP